MKLRAAAALVAALLIAGAIAHVVTADPIPEVRAPAPVVFVCRNGVAMSVWAAAYFNRLATRRDLPEWAIARASIPSFSEVPLNMTFALAIDGFRLAGYRPEVVSVDDVRDAKLVVAIDTELPAGARGGAAPTQVWDGFPPMREAYFPSRSALKRRVEALVDRLTEERTRLHAASDRPQSPATAMGRPPAP